MPVKRETILRFPEEYSFPEEYKWNFSTHTTVALMWRWENYGFMFCWNISWTFTRIAVSSEDGRTAPRDCEEDCSRLSTKETTTTKTTNYVILLVIHRQPTFLPKLSVWKSQRNAAKSSSCVSVLPWRCSFCQTMRLCWDRGWHWSGGIFPWGKLTRWNFLKKTIKFFIKSISSVKVYCTWCLANYASSFALFPEGEKLEVNSLTLVAMFRITVPASILPNIACVLCSRQCQTHRQIGWRWGVILLVIFPEPSGT